MSPLSKNERRIIYERTVAEFDAAQADYDALVAAIPELFTRITEAEVTLQHVEEDLAQGKATEEEYEEADRNLDRARDYLENVTSGHANILKGARDRMYAAYEDYIA